MFEEPSLSSFPWLKPRSCDMTCRGTLRESTQFSHGACLPVVQDETAGVKVSKPME
jgi:hypothetical protein